jgi:hypothetical protein
MSFRKYRHCALKPRFSVKYPVFFPSKIQGFCQNKQRVSALLNIQNSIACIWGCGQKIQLVTG